jgi:hypothetical protein
MEYLIFFFCEKRPGGGKNFIHAVKEGAALRKMK